jgi:hypothetical protein
VVSPLGGGTIVFVFGYLDAGSGSLLFQLLAGGIAGLAAYTRFRWHTVKGWFQKTPESDE